MTTTITALLTIIAGFIFAYFVWLFMAMRDKIHSLENENHQLASMILTHLMAAKDDPGEQNA